MLRFPTVNTRVITVKICQDVVSKMFDGAIASTTDEVIQLKLKDKRDWAVGLLEEKLGTADDIITDWRVSTLRLYLQLIGKRFIEIRDQINTARNDDAIRFVDACMVRINAASQGIPDDMHDILDI